MTTNCEQGVLAFGDSITNGGGELQWGVALQSWAQWVARGLGLPFTNYAVDGARASDVVSDQIPAHRRINAMPEPRYQLGCLYIGVNDVRSPEWDPVSYERDFVAALDYLHSMCDRVLTATIPTGLGKPPAGPAVAAANAVIERRAAESGTLVVDLRDFHGRELLMYDQVHPTAMGQLAIAERAMLVLEGDGLSARVPPRSFARPSASTQDRIRGVLTYAWRSAKLELSIRVRQALSRR